MRPRDPFPIDVRATFGLRDVGPVIRPRRALWTIGRLGWACLALAALFAALALKLSA